VPYRVDIRHPLPGALDALIEFGALDVDVATDGALAAIVPDDLTLERLVPLVGEVSASAAVGRDDGSVWVLTPRATRIGRLQLVPADAPLDGDTIRLADGPAFGTGLHPTTALCVEILQDLVDDATIDSMLDVGTGSGILALAALRLGVARATGLDIEAAALAVATENARLNGLEDRFALVAGDASAVDGRWPLVMANVLAAPLIEMAPVLAQRVAHGGVLVLSGITDGLAVDVDRAYRRVGMYSALTRVRDGWVALEHRPTW